MAKERLLKNTLIYFIGIMATRLLNFLFLPLYTKMILPDDYGYFNLVYSMLSVVMPVLFFMVWDVFLRFSLDSKDEASKNSVVTNVVLSAFALLAVYLIAYAVAGYFLPIKNLWLIALVAVSWLLAYIWQSGMRAYGQNKLYAISGAVATAVTVSVNLIFILVLNIRDITLYAAQIASFIIVFSIAEWKLKLLSKVRFGRFDWALMKRMLKFGTPLILNSIAFYLINGIGSLVIKAHMGDAAVGYFGAASRFSMIIATLTQIVYFAWQEEAFREAGSENLQSYASEVMDIYCRVLFGGVCFGLPLIKLALPYIINIQYAQAYALIPAVIMTAVFSALSSFAGAMYSAKMKTNMIMYTTIVGGVVSFLISWFGIKLFGLQAVAVAGGVGFLLVFIIRVVFSKDIIKITVSWLRFVALNLAVGAVIFVFFIDSKPLQLMVSAAGLVLFIFLNRKLMATVLAAVKNRGRRGGGGAPPPPVEEM